MVEGRIDPHKKAGYTLEINDRIADGEVGDYTSVRCTLLSSRLSCDNNLTQMHR
jgi:hypothetical protein